MQISVLRIKLNITATWPMSVNHHIVIVGQLMFTLSKHWSPRTNMKSVNDQIKRLMSISLCISFVRSCIGIVLCKEPMLLGEGHLVQTSIWRHPVLRYWKQYAVNPHHMILIPRKTTNLGTAADKYTRLHDYILSELVAMHLFIYVCITLCSYTVIHRWLAVRDSAPYTLK